MNGRAGLPRVCRPPTSRSSRRHAHVLGGCERPDVIQVGRRWAFGFEAQAGSDNPSCGPADLINESGGGLPPTPCAQGTTIKLSKQRPRGLWSLSAMNAEFTRSRSPCADVTDIPQAEANLTVPYLVREKLDELPFHRHGGFMRNLAPAMP